MLTFFSLILFEVFLELFVPAIDEPGLFSAEIYAALIIGLMLMFIIIVAVDNFRGRERTPFGGAVFYVFAMLLYLTSFGNYAALIEPVYANLTVGAIETLLSLTFFFVMPGTILAGPLFRGLRKYINFG